jgi:acetolactate synthase-1/2/3 large subunit
MTGAESLIKSLLASGVEVCFANPGTSEMHFVAALDRTEGMRCVLGLFEGVVTGAADGYARIAGKPAATLLHLGSGLGNGLANLHNARRGHVPIVNVVGDHATYHLQYDAPLTSDIEGIAAPVSGWVRTSAATDELGADAATAVARARSAPAQVATLILPADLSWQQTDTEPAAAIEVPEPPVAEEERVTRAVAALGEGASTLLLLGGSIDAAQLAQAGRIAEATGCRLACEVFPTRLARGAGTVAIERLPYLAELAIDYLKDVKTLVLAGAADPVSFFAYPNVPSVLRAEGSDVVELARVGEDVGGTLTAVVDQLNAGGVAPPLAEGARVDVPAGPLTGEAIAAAVAASIPDNAIVIDEGITSTMNLFGATACAAQHDYITLTGGAIGWGLPNAVGAAVAAPDRKVICLEGDGSAMYTIQALWTMAREQLDVTTVVFNNSDYAVLQLEYMRVGAEKMGDNARAMMSLGGPTLDFVAVARSMGVEAERVDTAEDLHRALREAVAHPGPRLIEAMTPALLPGF